MGIVRHTHAAHIILVSSPKSGIVDGDKFQFDYLDEAIVSGSKDPNNRVLGPNTNDILVFGP